MDVYDLVVIGSGPGGYPMLVRASQYGLKVACCEKSTVLGGTCLNAGCIPSKTLLYSTELYYEMKHHAKDYGITCTDVAFDFQFMMQRKDEVIEVLQKNVTNLFSRHNIDLYTGQASFLDPFTLKLSGSDTRIKSKAFVIATGSESVSLPFLPIDEEKIVTSTGILGLKKQPKSLVIIGGGVIGVEMASVYSRIGTKVTVIELLPHICPGFDTHVRNVLFTSLKDQGIEFFLDTKVQDAKVFPDHVTLKTTQKEFTSDVVLVSVGRRPNTKGLGLEQLGIDILKNGCICVDKSFRTKQKHIYAIGDVIEGPMLAHRASEEGLCVAAIVANKKAHIDYIAIPNVIYTEPELASVGYTEDELKALNIDYIKGQCPMKANSRARCTGKHDGLVIILAKRATKELLGMHILCHGASEMIAVGSLALSLHATLDDLAKIAWAHPTYSEAIIEATLQAEKMAIHL